MTEAEAAKRYFPDRGVFEETFKQFQAEVVFNPTHEQLVEWLGSNSYCLEAAVVFPNLITNPDDLSISVHSYYVRCFPPPIGSDGKPRKFLSTLGSTYRPYVLPPVWDVAYEIDQPIFIVEKQASALLLQQNKIPAIALDGTWGAGAKRIEGETVQLHQVLQEFDWIGRPVYLCFDSDFRSRESVLQGLVRTYVLFSISGAVVKVLEWEPQFKGLDDFVAGTAGLDGNKQREALDLLTATVSEIPAAKAAESWIIPQYRCLFEREIIAISPHMDQRSMLADQIFKALGTTAGDLKKSWRESTKPADVPSAELIVEDTEPWPEHVIPSELGDLLLARWKTHLVTSNVNYWTLVLWQILTHLKDSLSLMPQLGICSAVKRCGKTRTLEVLERTVWKGLLAASVSPAATIRTIEKYEPCFLIDEFDAFLKENEEFRGVLNTCHSRGIKHIRCQPETHEPQAFNAFCAVAIALIGELPSTVEDRAIVLYLKRKQSSQRVMPVRKVPPETFVELRRKICRFILDYRKDILDAIPVLPKLSNDRALENWEPLAQIAQILGGDWPHRAFLCAKNLTPSDSDDQSFAIRLLVSLRGLFKARGLDQPGREEKILPTSDITIELNKDTEAPWADRKQYFAGLTAKKLSLELRRFRVHSRRDQTQSGRPVGYWWKDLGPVFLENLGDEDPPPPPDPPSDPPPSPPSPGAVNSPISEKPPYSGDGSWYPGSDPQNSLYGSKLSVNQGPKLNPVFEKEIFNPGKTLTYLTTSPSEESNQDTRVQSGNTNVFIKSLPPSTPQAHFCTPTHPERLLFLDTETFYPFSESYSQPPLPSPGYLIGRQNKSLAHPWAKDSRRCALRFLTIHDTDGTFGAQPLTIDFQANLELPASVLDALANCTLVGHNLDFDLSVLRRCGFMISSAVIDSMLGSRLLGLGKEKLKFSSDIAYCDLDEEELEEIVSLEDPNPVDHDLATVVKRYLGIRMEKARTKLGGSDWSRTDLSPAHYSYMAEDVGYLPALWNILEKELREAGLEAPFRERMKFFPHLNQIKMTGIPIDIGRRDADYQRVTEEKTAVREELRVMFVDYRHPIPKSRLKTLKIQTEGGKFKRVPGPTDEEFSPSNRDHVLGALAHRGILVGNTQEATLKKLDAPECRLLLKYTGVKKRLEAIKGIARSTFSDDRVRAAGWNQLSARTGRMTSTEPNLQQIPRDWRNGFRVEPPKLWLKGDLSQIEMVLIAIVTGDENLIRLLRSGRDVYVEYGARIFGKKPERGPGDDQITERLRDVAKVPTLGISYGLTPFGFVRRIRDELGIEFDIQEAQGFFETFFEMFPQIAAYHEKAAEDAFNLDSIRTIGGTRRWLPPLLEDQIGDYWPSFERRKKILVNTPIQGSGADLVIWAVNQFMPQLPAGVEIVNLVHDEVDAIVTRETLQPTVEIITALSRRHLPASILARSWSRKSNSPAVQVGEKPFRSMEPGLELFPFQEEGIRFTLEREGTLIADEMGLGKSAQAIGVINRDPSIRKVLIVCPVSMRIPWRRELERWLDRRLSIAVVGVDVGFVQTLFSKNILIINWDRLSRFAKELSASTYDLCILDECHYAKSLEAKRTGAALAIRAHRRIALSGTPILNRPIEIYPVLSWLSPGEWPADQWFAFATRYCGARHNGFGWDLSGASNLPELSQRLHSTVMIRRTKAQVLPQLPAKLRTVVELYPDAEMKRILKRELKAFETRFLRVDHGSIDWDDLAVVRHETALAKVPLVIEYASELLEGGVRKVVIFAHHRDVIARLAEGLSRFKPVILIGGMAPQARQNSIDAFQEDSSVRVFLGNIQAAGTGITLAPAASVCLFAELSWVPAEMSQCEDRLHRIGTIDSVTVQHLVLEGSLDAMMVKVLIKKQRVLDAVLEFQT